MVNNTPMSPKVLSNYLGQKFPPTDQQAAVIGADPGPLLVVAGAGAGKTETMASRVVWLVANGFARPEEILGLTFTRKAAQELGRRIRDRLSTLAANTDLVRRLDPTGTLADALTVITPTVATYDAYAADLVREYGLLVPVEPDARLITAAELNSIARDVVTNYTGELGASSTVGTVTENLLALVTEMDNDLHSPEWIREEADAFIAEVDSLPKGPRQRTELTKPMEKWLNAQQLRRDYLPLVTALKQELAQRGVVTFNEQMSVAARLARDHAQVGASQRRRFRVVMLDEYQDTSHAQRVLLRSLFGEGRDYQDHSQHNRTPLTVTAVGDPMQAIYGWRGATAANLAAFVEDFPLPNGQPAPKRELTTSWRNPPEVLELANSVSDAVLGRNPATRAVARLESRPDPDPGEVTLGFFATEAEEMAFVADTLAEQFHSEDEFSAAVLVRKNAHSALMAEQLEQRGIPYEIVGLAGLLDVPEVADVVALATMLVRPEDSQASLRILTGPACGLGAADLVALSNRAANLSAAGSGDDDAGGDGDAADGKGEEQHPTDPLDRLRHELDQLVVDTHAATSHPDQQAGLTDAVADLGEPERYSEEGLRRLRELSSKLRQLRMYSLGKRLPDVIADIISLFNIRTEVLSRPSTTGTVHLDRLADEVAAYPGASLDGLLDYFALAREHEDGLTPGTVAVRTDRVQILTAHKAKGLEWDTVAVVHADQRTYSAKAETFLTQVQRLPSEEFTAIEEASDKKEFEDAGQEFLKEVRQASAEETARLFYVAITRAERRLLITGSATTPTTRKATGPYEHFEALSSLVDDSQIAAWVSSEEASADEESAQPQVEEGTWPQAIVDTRTREATEKIDAALEDLPEATPGELFDLWERDTTALIEEYEALQSPDVDVEVPSELTASDVVAIKADPEQFARRARRPVPFKPNAYAKRGTAFHEWIEDFYGARPLLDEDELPGNDEADVDADTLVTLKEGFQNSHWAQKTPRYIEHPFEIALGNSVVRGRMDAVFLIDDTWWVVDWKTGLRPTGAEMETAKIQLAVYREAWKRIADDGRDVATAFFYVRTGEDFAPRDVPDREELEKLLEFSHRDTKDNKDSGETRKAGSS